ncbi:MAK10-like protein, partial [Tanacetum coccineum]
HDMGLNSVALVRFSTLGTKVIRVALTSPRGNPHDLVSIWEETNKKSTLPEIRYQKGIQPDEVFLALGWHLEEIHMTWAHLKKKRMRLRTCTKIHQEVLLIERGDGVVGIKRRRHDLSGDGVWILAMVSQHAHSADFGLRIQTTPKDFLKLADSLDLDGENMERTRLCLFQFSLRDQASNWLERLPAGSITTWEDLTTRFLAQFFPPGRTAKLRNDILMFQQHHGESLSEAWTLQIFYDHVNPVTRRTIDQSAGGKLRDRNAKESWALLEDLALYDNESWNDPRDFAKPVKAITLPQDVPSTSDRRLIELENQVQRLMESHLAPMQPTQVNKITTSCEICSGPHDT